MQQEKLLDILFNSGESVCVSPNQKAYHSVDLASLWNGDFTLMPVPEAYDQRVFTHDMKDMQLIAINPIKGFRRDENVTAYRSFLVELDDGALKDQFDYVKSIGLPFSVCCYSGSKSLHFAVTLDEDLPDEETYRLFSEWILRIVEKADQKTKNPSRSIRFAGNTRKETGKQMKLIDVRSRVSLSDLMFWLSKYPEKDPRLEYVRRNSTVAPSVEGVPVWVWNKLKDGIDESKGRNNEWFGIFMEFCKAGYEYEDIIESLQDYFTPERDFRITEWKTIAKSAYKRVGKQHG